MPSPDTRYQAARSRRCPGCDGAALCRKHWGSDRPRTEGTIGRQNYGHMRNLDSVLLCNCMSSAETQHIQSDGITTAIVGS
ncbi:hypothetical protein PS662_03483 [Pseudomonas fluorescens]|uniref:Uncharacterized protein n=1 Tax=Pseudomonas fluorescens TaxID=294 RepID=A0A5E6UDK1_PSEFL|nr:hypothetical protein PS662_03483 [Pseudomonas fluorescens]